MKKQKIAVKVLQTTRISYELTLSADALRAVLVQTGYKIPEGASIIFTVPGGGDWSHTTIDITEENPVSVRWTETR